MRVRHLDRGTMHPPGGWLVDGEPGLFRRARIVCHCLLLESPAGLVLVESGFGTRILATGEHPNRDVTIGEHAFEPVALPADRQGTDPSSAIRTAAS